VPADFVSFVGAFEQGAALMGEEAILALTRVLGAGANNVAEAAVALLVMNAFERAQRRAEAAWSWLGSGPAADGGTEGPTEVVALGVRRPGGVDGVGPVDGLARPEPGLDPVRIGRLDGCRARTPASH
jgi:hypothetical protein